jgi:hypothetical protein
VHLSWIESHATALGAPDANYCAYGVEGWLELKVGPNFEVLPSQVAWFRDRLAAGGHPLFFVYWGDYFMVIPGDRALALRRDPSEENCLRLASSRWHGWIPDREFLRVLRNPRGEYERTERNIREAGE